MRFSCRLNFESVKSEDSASKIGQYNAFGNVIECVTGETGMIGSRNFIITSMSKAIIEIEN